MSYEQLLHDFVDGSLDYQGEMTLFAELQSNEGLRRELKLLMLMQKAAQHDVKAFTPAPESHDAIFARLGFSPGLAEAQAAHGGTSAAGGGFTTGLVGGIIGALMVGMVVLLSGRWPPDAGSHTEGRGGAAEEMAAARKGTIGSVETPASDAGAGSTGTRAASEPSATASDEGVPRATASEAGTPRHARRTRDAAPEMAEDFGVERAIASTPSLPRARSVRMLRSIPDIPEPRATAPSEASVPLTPAELPVASPLEGSARGSIGLRGVIGRGFEAPPAPLASPSDDPLLDRAISIEYRLDVNRRVGVEAGRESFYQRFTEMLPTGDILQHEQNPALLWGGVSFTQLFGEGPGVQIFLGGLAGATRMGPIGRISVGAEYDLGSNVRLRGGGEIAALAYSFDGSWLLSPKYGFTYGLSMGF